MFRLVLPSVVLGWLQEDMVYIACPDPLGKSISGGTVVLLPAGAGGRGRVIYVQRGTRVINLQNPLHANSATVPYGTILQQGQETRPEASVGRGVTGRAAAT